MPLGKPWRKVSLFFVFLALVQCQQQLPQQLQVCLRDIEEDICPQREGYDTECDARCGQLYPMRIGSGCRTRQTGQLLSFFGIRSFVCTCHLAPIACANPQFAVHPYHTLVVQQHSNLTPIPKTVQSCANPTSSLSCRDPSTCGWQFSREFEWYMGRANGLARPRESPENEFVGGTSEQGATWATISTCDGLCSSTSVNLTARVWRPPTVMVELCFKEKETTMCAPVHATNGHLINEIIPETNFFQILLRFSNVTAGEMILISDLGVSYQPCQKVKKPLLRTMHSTNITTTHIRNAQGLPIKGDPKMVAHRMCQNGECAQYHSSSTAKMCVGRPGLAYCRQKCKAIDASEQFPDIWVSRPPSGNPRPPVEKMLRTDLTKAFPRSSARCLRQRENPLIKKCICHVRRSPVRRIENQTSPETTVSHDVEMNRISEDEVTFAPNITSTTESMEPIETMETTETEEIMETTEPSTTTVITEMPSTTQFPPTTHLMEMTNTPELIILDSPRGRIFKCLETNCNFEKDTKCGWADLRMLSKHFNNISVAMKKGDENRYGISRLEPKSYSGLLYKAPLIGPISMSIDVFPSHELDVRICVQNLRKCQTQTIAARSWNRISAKIKVQSTEKIFVLFYNNALETRSIAIDNIVVRNGACF